MCVFSVKKCITLPKHVHLFGEKMHYSTQTYASFRWKYALLYPNMCVFSVKKCITLPKHVRLFGENMHYSTQSCPWDIP
jgi:hypothetical protein